MKTFVLVPQQTGYFHQSNDAWFVLDDADKHECRMEKNSRFEFAIENLQTGETLISHPRYDLGRKKSRLRSFLNKIVGKFDVPSELMFEKQQRELFRLQFDPLYHPTVHYRGEMYSLQYGGRLFSTTISVDGMFEFHLRNCRDSVLNLSTNDDDTAWLAMAVTYLFWVLESND